MVWGIFSWHTFGLLVPIEHRLNITVYLSIVADHVHPFMTTVYHLLMYFQQDNAPSQRSNHLRLVSWTWQWVHFTQMSSTVTRSQSNRAALGCGGTRDSHHGCADDKSAATAWCYHDNMTNISEECFQHLVESMPRRIKTDLKTKGVQPGTSKVYLIKWPVSVYTSIKKKEIWHWILAYCFLKSPILFSMLTFAASQPYEANRRPAWSVNWGPPVSRVPGGPSGPGPARKPALDAGWCSPGWCECSSQSNRLIGRENYRLCR